MMSLLIALLVQLENAQWFLITSNQEHFFIESHFSDIIEGQPQN